LPFHFYLLPSAKMLNKELNETEWAGEMNFISFGVRVGVRVNDERVMGQLPRHLPPLLRPTKAPVDKLYSIVFREPINRRRQLFHKLFEDAEEVANLKAFDAILNLFESNVQLYIAEHSPRRVFVHAGVVGWQGQAIVIPGRSFSGKTSLVVELLKAGATYYSDEYAVLDERGLVHPYPRLLSVRDNGSFTSTKHSVEELGGKAGKKPLPIGLVLASKYKEGARFRPREMTEGESVLAMFNNTVSARRQPAFALATIRQAITGAQCLRGRRGEAAETVTAVLKKFTP
jgi:hypothetical protein